MKIQYSRKGGFTLVEIMIVVGIIGMLGAIAIPNFIRARNTSQKHACINNLRQIDAAKQQWVMEYKKPSTATPDSDDLKSYFKNNRFPTCPASGNYTIGAANTDPTCDRANHVFPN